MFAKPISKWEGKSNAVRHLELIQKKDEYGTPFNLFNDACREYNIYPKFDVAASRYNHVLYDYWTKADNSLNKDWPFDFFMNPPYSNISNFMRKAYQEHINHNVNALILTYNKTDTKWWHRYVKNKAETHFIEGRLRFLDEFGKLTKNSAPYPSVWIIYRKKW